MGRRARIAKVEENGTVTSIHCQWASIEETGMALNTFLADEEGVDSLMKIGDISGLQALPRYKFDSDKHIMVSELDDEITIVVATRVRPGRIDSDESLKKFLENPTYDRERSFIWDRGEWLVTSRDIADCMVPLSKMREVMTAGIYYPSK